MKKIINFILSLLICSMVISCGNEVPLELKEATVAEGICKLFVEKKYKNMLYLIPMFGNTATWFILLAHQSFRYVWYINLIAYIYYYRHTMCQS